MAIFTPSTLVEAEAQQTASRDSVARLIRGSQALPRVVSTAAAAQLVADATDSGVVFSATNPLYVYRSDRRRIEMWDGTAWSTVTDPPATKTAVGFVPTWNTSTLNFYRAGGIISVHGCIYKNSGIVPPGSSMNIGWVNDSSLRPPKDTLIPAVTIVTSSGSITDNSRPRGVLWLAASGGVHVISEINSTYLEVHGSFEDPNW